jgi:hypothetical protein
MNWLPIESAPRDGTVILGLEIQSLLGEDRIRLPIHWEDDDWRLAWTCWADETDGFNATHWMPLPEPPQ